VKPRIIVRPLADSDLGEQAAYLARSSLKAALRFYRATELAFETLAAMPGMGSVLHSSRAIEGIFEAKEE
jgi:plasmid stabilization system protein ParE